MVPVSELRDENPLDDWGRLRRRLRQMSDDASQAVMSGGCTHEDYLAQCARHSTLKEVIELTSEIRRGDDLKESSPSAVGSWWKAVEE